MKNILIILLFIFAIVSTGYIIKNKNSAGTQVEKQSINSENAQIENREIITVKNAQDLSGRALTQVPMNIFDKTNTEELNLSNNNLTGSPPSQIGNLKKLKVLDLSNNDFTGVPAEIGHLKYLEILNLSNNNLTGLPNELGGLSNLKLLDLSGNNYSEQDLFGIKNNLPSSVIIKTN